MSEQTIHAMTVTIEPNGYRPTFKATCSDPSADCHYICAEMCEEWGEIIRNEAGAVIGHVVEGGYGTHHMEWSKECNYAAWIDESDDVNEDMTGKPFTFTIPAKFTFNGDHVTWEANA